STCGLCGSVLNDRYCDYCKMELGERYISKDGKRIEQSKMFLGYPSEIEVYSSTPELMKKETIELYCLLREARKMRADVYQLRKVRHDAEKEVGFNDDVKVLEEKTYAEYEDATRKVWVIENIIKDRLGYYPKRISNNFLNVHLGRIEESEEKKMQINQ